jgi:hypothetical protein
MATLRITNVQCINWSDVCNHLGLDSVEREEAEANLQVSYGDALFTLIGNNEALYALERGIRAMRDPGRNTDDLVQSARDIIGERYVNVEA